MRTTADSDGVVFRLSPAVVCDRGQGFVYAFNITYCATRDSQCEGTAIVSIRLQSHSGLRPFCEYFVTTKKGRLENGWLKVADQLLTYAKLLGDHFGCKKVADVALH